MKLSALTFCGFVLAGTSSFAQQPVPQACGSELQQFKREWNEIALPTASKPGARVESPGHSHAQGEIDVMMFHAKKADELCKQGKDHEALLHMDMVRAWMKLPDLPHPASHNYQLK